MTGQKRPAYKSRVGDERWRVDWVSRIKVDPETGEVDRDDCVESSRLFDTYEAALAFAVKTWPTTTDKFGVVEIMPVRFVPYDEADAGQLPWVGFWEVTDDPLMLTDDSGVPER